MNLSLPQSIRRTPRSFPLLAVLAAGGTLLLLLVIYTSENLSRSRERLEQSLYQEGVALIRAIEAGNRTGMRMRWATNQLQMLVEEVGKVPKVVSISVIADNGTILADTDSRRIGQPVGMGTLDFPVNEAIRSKTFREQQRHVFEIVAQSKTPQGNQTPLPGGHGHGAGNPMRMMTPEAAEHLASLPQTAFIRIVMDMSELDRMRHDDLKDAAIMLLLLVVIGSAALYAIVSTQNYVTVHQTLRTMQTYTQHVVDSMANGLISLNAQGGIVTINRQACQMFGLRSGEDVQGKPLQDVVTLPDFDLFGALAQGERILEKEVNATISTGQTLPLSLSASTLHGDADEPLGAVLLLRDLSDVKALQEQVQRAERLASVGRLAAGVAHEIRNPLGSLKGFLQYFQRKLPMQEQDKAYLTVMMNEVDRLNTVVSNLLEFARPKEPVFEDSDTPEILEHVLMLLHRDFEAKHLRLFREWPEALPHLQMDQDQITQVLLNILLNAIQATESGGEIHVSAQALREMNLLEIAVRDTGSGIAADDLPHIFDPFFSTKKQGNGLGLAIAHTIIEQHHGDILVESHAGQGSAFRIRLPLSIPS
ncbi:signal transduction histidine kinase, nitrogen specific, NtrB [Candidatus Moduliflexus flocculans]|uniref:histidine kinase n=1 Tax=Candidatus Moduliflexus flocculans TaxID=1499966 RepID=A0A081BQ78_9BACT|nr:signal transduction histidine kinase, nitrogen specific, NtrB [Candidatus Moduliflexus flocculans]